MAGPNDKTTDDIRDRSAIDHDDIMALNFICDSAPVVFRRHFRQGLRSHIMEILDPREVAVERSGKRIDGVMRFPRAEPRRMLRIFRTRLTTLGQALEEIGRVKIVERFLAPDCLATSVECIVDYRASWGRRPVLCGFQEYVAGEVLDPWTVLDRTTLLPSLFDRLRAGDNRSGPAADSWMAAVRKRTEGFVGRIKRMIAEAGHVPDLAGVGNLIITPAGGIRLVDINNISPVDFAPDIPLDEKGYPVCDKSVEALALIEQKVLGRTADRRERLYRHYLEPERMQAVKVLEASFRKRISGGDQAVGLRGKSPRPPGAGGSPSSLP